MVLAALVSLILPSIAQAAVYPWGSAKGWTRTVPEGLNDWMPFNDAANSPGSSIAAVAPTGSLSGTVRYDGNSDGLYFGPQDSPIIGATVWLYRMDNLASAVAMASTDWTGAYHFLELPADSYAIALGYPRSPHGLNSLGQVFDSLGTPTAGSGTMLAVEDRFINLVLPAGGFGTGYDFGETVAPLSKRQFFTSPPPPPPPPIEAPEAGGLLTWLGLALCSAVLYWRTRRVRNPVATPG